MTPTEREEVVAKALFGRGELPGSYVPFDMQPLEIKEHYYRLAQIGIAAMDIEQIEREAFERGRRELAQQLTGLKALNRASGGVPIPGNRY